MANKIQIRRDTTANWIANDPVLSQGELGLDINLHKIKIGNGTTIWSELDFFIGDTGPQGETGIQGAIGPQGPAGVTELSELTNGSATLTLNSNGTITLPLGGDIINEEGNSVLNNIDIYKFAYGIIGTKDNPDTGNGWGGYNMYLDPGGESWASIFIPSVASQNSGAALQITNKGAANSIVQVFGWGGVQLVTNTGLNEKLFEFGDNGQLTLPTNSSIVSESSSTISVGAGLAELETIYTDTMLMLDDIFTQLSSESGYPWGITLPLSVPLTYDQLIQLPPDTFTNQTVFTATAHNATTAYNVWRDAAATTNIQVNVSNKSWIFGNDGKLTLPGGNAQIVAELDGGIRIGTANTNVAPNNQIRIGGADHVFEIFGGPPAYSWKFEADGKLKLPGTSYASTSQNYIHAEYGIGLHPTHNTGGTGPELYISYNDGILIQPFTNDYLQGGIAAAALFITGSDLPNGNDSIGKLPGDVYIESGTNYQDSTHGKVVVKSGTNQWKFNSNGTLTLPISGVPEHSYGSVGDKAGMLVVDATYIYYCTANYDAATPAADIWKRTAHGTGTW